MNCQDVQRLLQPYADGELDLLRHVQIEEHLSACAACAEQEKHLRSLREAIASSSLYHRAPASLRSRIQRAIPSVPRQRRSSLRWAAIAASILLLIGTTATLAMLFSRGKTSADDRLAEWVIAGHVRSLQVGHLMDVPSSNRHEVKPWLSERLDFSPPVPDLAPQGYPLSGGRLDYLSDRPVAALVYHRHLHIINLFIWPAANDEEKAVRRLARQGYHLRSWQRSGMNYWAISDLNDQELDEFVRLFQEQSREPTP